MGMFSNIGSEVEAGFKVNGLTFTGAFLNGRMMVISDQLPVKARSGKKIHMFHIDEIDPFTKQPYSVIVMSQEMHDALMTDAMEERNKVESLSSQ
jgi:hypothetical protein